jgi:hypothetical protein
MGYQYTTKHLRRNYQYAYNPEGMQVLKERLKRWLGFGSILSFKRQLHV